MFVCWAIPLQDAALVCHDCLVVNGNPPETRTRVLTYGHSPGPLRHDIDLGLDGLQALAGTAENGNRGMSSGEQGLRNRLRERIGLLKRFIYCKC